MFSKITFSPRPETRNPIIKIFLPNLSALRPPIMVPTTVILNAKLTNQLSSIYTSTRVNFYLFYYCFDFFYYFSYLKLNLFLTLSDTFLIHDNFVSSRKKCGALDHGQAPAHPHSYTHTEVGDNIQDHSQAVHIEL